MSIRSLYDALSETVENRDSPRRETSMTFVQAETMDDKRSPDTAYTSIVDGGPRPHDRGRTERTAMPETFDERRPTMDSESSLLPSARALLVDRPRTGETAKIEIVDRNRRLPHPASPTIGRSLYERLSEVSAGGVDQARTEETKAVETIDNDRVAPHDGSALFRPTNLYAALAMSVGASSTDRGRTQITEADAGETMDNDRSPRGLWA